VPTPTAQVVQPDVPLSPNAAADAAAQKTGFDSQGNPVATSGPKRPFILDPLLQ
jgi:hypothetical protein